MENSELIIHTPLTKFLKRVEIASQIAAKVHDATTLVEGALVSLVDQTDGKYSKWKVLNV